MLKLSKKWQALFLKKTLAITLILISIFTLTPQLPVMAADAPILLSPSMVTNESGRGNAGNLVDESNNAGYPPTSDPSTYYWMPGWSSSYYPASAYIDLGQQYSISQIWYRDENGIGTVTFATGTPGNWTTLFTDGMGGYLVWRNWSGSITTRYLRVTLATTGAAQSLYDLVLYGKPQ